MAGTVISVVLVGIVVITFVMMTRLLFIKNSYNARYQIILCMALLCYALGYYLEVNAATVGEAVFALRVENLAIPAVGPFFLLFIMHLCDSKFLTDKLAYIFMGYAMLMFLVVVTNEWHHLFYTSYYLEFGLWSHLTMGKGPLYYVNQLVGVGCVMVSYVLLAQRFFRWTVYMRGRMLLIVLGSVIGFVSNVLNVLGLLGGLVDIMPFAGFITLVFFYVGVFRNRLYEQALLGATDAVQSMDDAMVVIDGEGGLVYYNNAAATLFPGMWSSGLNTPINLVPGWPKKLQNITGEGFISVQASTARGVVHFRCNVTRIQGGASTGWSVVLRDVTDAVNLTNRLEQLADTDELTQIYNRRHFIAALEKEIKRVQRYGTPASLIMFDLDYFKRINDTYGHAVGDRVLVAVTKTVQEVLRGTDVFGRYGGEEFLILCPNTSEEEASALAERIRFTVEDTPIKVEGETILTVSASFGTTAIRQDDVVDNVVTRADKAMYASKSGGRNRVSSYTAVAG